MNARLAAALVAPLLAAGAHAASTLQVDVAKHGATFVVSAVLTVPVPLPEAWAVMNDFDDMERFVPTLTESGITARQGNLWTVEQKGVAHFGPFRFAYESVRELELTPTEKVVARQIRGATRSARSETSFAPADGATRITYQAEVEPGFWVPAFISRRILEQRVREQFDALGAEMMRRRTRAASALPLETRAQEGR